MNKAIGLEKNTCISTYPSTCEKSIYETNKIKLEQGAGSVINHSYNQQILLNDSFSAREINLENILIQNHKKFETSRIFKELLSEELKPSDYITLVESYIPKELISSTCLGEIKNLASNFSENMSSFLIFESRLKSFDAKSDYCFAVSSKNGEREILADLIKSGHLVDKFSKQSEWIQLGNFVKNWIDPKSIIYDNVIGLWFEFDTAGEISNAPTPSIFIQPTSYNKITGDVSSQYTWITKSALPLLLGKPLSNKLEKKVLKCIKNLPLESSLFQIGTMLSRKDDKIRLVLNKFRVDQIIPYLTSIGWLDDENNSLSALLEEIKNKVTRIVLHISVGEKIDSKVGIECSFYPNKYYQEQGWEKFLDYLLEKKLCNKEKYSALIRFPGIEPQYHDQDFNTGNYIPSVMLLEENNSNALVRYISHIKLVYQPYKSVEAKAYFAVRLFGHSYGAVSIKQ